MPHAITHLEIEHSRRNAAHLAALDEALDDQSLISLGRTLQARLDALAKWIGDPSERAGVSLVIGPSGNRLRLDVPACVVGLVTDPRKSALDLPPWVDYSASGNARVIYIEPKRA